MRKSFHYRWIPHAALLTFFALFGMACGTETKHVEVNDIVVLDQPNDAEAGETVHVSFGLMGDDNKPFKAAGVDIDVTLNKNAFDSGGTVISGATDDEGVVHVQFSISEVDTRYALVASSSHEALEGRSVSTIYFEIIAGAASAEKSSISGTNGVIHDSEGAKVTVTLSNAHGIPIAGVVPTYEASGEGNTYGVCSATDNLGVATCTMTSTRVGFKTLKITAPVAVKGDTIEFFWDCDEGSNLFGGGSGEPTDPYRICAPGHLDEIGNDDAYMDKHFVISSDIDLKEIQNFQMIGSVDSPFIGQMDGGGFTIKNLNLAYPDETHIGLFRHVGEGGKLQRIRLEEFRVEGAEVVGGLVGLMNSGAIADCFVEGVVIGRADESGDDEYWGVGGLVGIIRETGRIQNCSCAGSVKGDSAVGGLVGEVEGGRILDSYSTSSVEGLAIIGGLIGSLYDSSVLRDSYATGHVRATGWGGAGGLVGDNWEAQIERSHATGQVEGEEVIGGLVGFSMDAKVSSSYSTGNVVGERIIGGLVGGNEEGVIVDSYATGNVDGKHWVGGLLGLNGADDVPGLGGDIQTSYSTGLVTGDDSVGGLVGKNDGGEVTSSYWDTEASEQSTSDGGAPLTTTDFADPENFTDWDFTDTWVMGTAPDEETRPILQWQAE